LLPGNHLEQKDQPAVVHYSASAGFPNGFSIGDWGPVKVGNNPADPGYRAGAPVITIEVYNPYVDKDVDSGSFAADGRQLFDDTGKSIDPSTKVKKLDNKSLSRSQELQTYANALMEVFLEHPFNMSTLRSILGPILNPF